MDQSFRVYFVCIPTEKNYVLCSCHKNLKLSLKCIKPRLKPWARAWQTHKPGPGPPEAVMQARLGPAYMGPARAGLRAQARARTSLSIMKTFVISRKARLSSRRGRGIFPGYGERRHWITLISLKTDIFAKVSSLPARSSKLTNLLIRCPNRMGKISCTRSSLQGRSRTSNGGDGTCIKFPSVEI